jgi:dTDP-4-dehydrorhamnose reductase
MNILITGAKGFIGSYLSTNLIGKVYAPSKEELNLVNSFQVNQFFKNNKIDIVIHCATKGRNSVRSYDTATITENLLAWNNLYCNKQYYGKLINIASGAEFDIDTNIENKQETDIWNSYPKHSYGLSKNSIAKIVQITDKFYNVRVFGCFDISDDDNRPIKRMVNSVVNGSEFLVQDDKYFDMISLIDLRNIIITLIQKDIPYSDINAVYPKKLKLSDILIKYCEIHNLNCNKIKIGLTSTNNYTGNSSRIETLGIELLGLENSLKLYRTSDG